MNRVPDEWLKDDGEGTLVPPVQKVTCERHRLRAVFYVADNATVDDEGRRSLLDKFDKWLDGEGPLLLQGITRMELYELPKNG